MLTAVEHPGSETGCLRDLNEGMRSEPVFRPHTMFCLPESDIRQFRKDGYLLVPGVYAPEALEAMRAPFAEAFARQTRNGSPYDSSTLLTDIYTHFPGLSNLIFNEKYVAAVQALAGPGAVLIPECALHRGRYINWHTDTTEQEIAGLDSHHDLATPVLQVATYFQDNDPDTGGGLTLIPGTHRLQDPFLHLYSKKWSHRIWNKALKITGLSVFDRLEAHPEKRDVPSRVGDLLIFDVRVFHRATARRVQGEHEKFAVFNTFTLDTPAGMDYFRFMKRRPEPYYRYFREKPLDRGLRRRAAELGIRLLY